MSVDMLQLNSPVLIKSHVAQAERRADDKCKIFIVLYISEGLTAAPAVAKVAAQLQQAQMTDPIAALHFEQQLAQQPTLVHQPEPSPAPDLVRPATYLTEHAAVVHVWLLQSI